MELLKPRQSPRLVNRQEGRQRSPLWKALPVAAGASVPVNANTGSDVCGQTQPRPREPTPEICIDQKFFRAAEQHGQATEQLVSRQEGRRENPHRLPLPVAAGAPVQVNEDREALSEERLFLQTLPRWKSSGFPENDLKAMGYTPYQPMVFVTCDLVAAANIKLTVIDSIRRPVNVPQNSLVNLSEPRDRETWGSVTDMRPPVALTDIEPERPRTSWATGVETSKVYHIELCYPTQMVYDRRIPCSTLSCRRETQTYRTVDLSAPPEHGCKHVELITSEFPNKTQADQPKLLMIKSSDTLYLGPVCTIENITGLLVHKVFTNNVNLLEDILDMHTSLQVHPFIPRTFALHLTKLPFLCMPAVGMYVGEAAGIWNTGSLYKECVPTACEKATLAYHVTQCLLRAQILSLRILGFTLKCIQPARIWRWRTGFRLDFIACLADTMYMWRSVDPHWGALEGLATIHTTLQQLGLLDHLPELVKVQLAEAYATLFHTQGRQAGRRLRCSSRTRTRSEPGGEDLLHTVYNLCKFTDEETSVDSTWETILGSDRYKHIFLKTPGLIIQPYGPFYIRIHHQRFTWNKAIIVEPVRFDRSPGLPTVIPLMGGISEDSNEARAKVPKVSRKNCSSGCQN
ncbi:hypothetical protein DPEC_G00068860 [Dallia pectoralis]|uniref:Uncharacterized protein n=1 Tax=Dallia pectoralis TaxID=75939 RepID=A0ACC2H1R2_DALPE|nr:hypothetical protein DPEC_G00068860 [Dallia pectoralis]